ncbi:MAG: class I SAM-dependent methyltransferase, partial [Desulfarculaceae bacterium]|nr:class I SAM-dependent methyltransferase [Desulfarculaceae bacterium]MCF8049203.1 class I SAM-dependent methyltransferase [Desulfarculaceae bacterium]
MSDGQGHILIGGTGRSGTTLLVQILTHLNFDTGFSKEDALNSVDNISRAGLETRLDGDDLPYVIKSPWLSDEIKDALQGGFKVEAAIIPMRDLFEAAESRRHVYRQAEVLGKDPLAQPGSIWKTTEPGEQEGALALELYKFIDPLVTHDIPLVFLSFPRFVEDGDYFHQQLKPIFDRHGVGRDEVLRVHRQIADPGLITKFRAPQSGQSLSPSPPPTPPAKPMEAQDPSRLGALLSAASFWRPEYFKPSAWIEHAPLAFWLMEAARPRVLVELGTAWGYSFFAFCQAVRTLGLSTQCHAVDIWKGHPQGGIHGEESFLAASQHHREHYQDFASLLRMTFDEALPHIPDGSVDLLHIDGLHTYEAVSHDFYTWLPKLSPRAVVLFHDTAVKNQGFGVHRLWGELTARHPHFEFVHGHGLGVLAVGAEAPPRVLEFCQASSDARLTLEIRAAYQRLGASLTAEIDALQAHQDRLLAEALVRNQENWQIQFNNVV